VTTCRSRIQLNGSEFVSSKTIADLDNSDLWYVLQLFYPMFKNLIKDVAELTGMSIGHVQRVLQGDRGPNPQIVEALISEFRKRITADADEKRVRHR
jgi:transcriptional regulator with XRE-family HTH domain